MATTPKDVAVRVDVNTIAADLLTLRRVIQPGISAIAAGGQAPQDLFSPTRSEDLAAFATQVRLNADPATQTYSESIVLDPHQPGVARKRATVTSEISIKIKDKPVSATVVLDADLVGSNGKTSYDPRRVRLIFSGTGTSIDYSKIEGNRRLLSSAYGDIEVAVDAKGNLRRGEIS